MTATLEALTATSLGTAGTSSRREKTALLAAVLRELAQHPREVRCACAWLSGQLPQGRIGVGPSLVHRIAAEPAAVASLTVAAVDEIFDRIAATAGAGATRAREAELGALFARATAAEQRFLAGLLTGELRQGAQEGLVLEAVASAAGVAPAAVRRAAMLAGDVGEVAVAVLTEGSAGLARFGLVLLRPLQPMLADTAADVNDALSQLGRAAFEWKLDGARVQVHRLGDRVRVFSRSLLDVTAAVPELVEAIGSLPVRALVLDGEAIALAPDGRPRPFQVTMRRFGRRLDIDRTRAEIPLSSLFFDCLHLDGEDLIDRPAVERVAALRTVVPDDAVIPRLETDDGAEAAGFFEQALARGHEGIVAKSLDAGYEAGRRGASWLKIKRAHTLDLVVLAAEWGSGRRRGWLSNLHLGARDSRGSGFVMLGKTFKGLTDAMLDWQTARLRELEVGSDEHTVFVRPELVVEVAFDGVQASPQYPAGVALRFARVVRHRPDKPAAEADTIDAVLALHAPDA